MGGSPLCAANPCRREYSDHGRFGLNSISYEVASLSAGLTFRDVLFGLVGRNEPERFKNRWRRKT